MLPVENNPNEEEVETYKIIPENEERLMWRFIYHFTIVEKTFEHMTPLIETMQKTSHHFKKYGVDDIHYHFFKYMVPELFLTRDISYVEKFRLYHILGIPIPKITERILSFKSLYDLKLNENRQLIDWTPVEIRRMDCSKAYFQIGCMLEIEMWKHLKENSNILSHKIVHQRSFWEAMKVPEDLKPEINLEHMLKYFAFRMRHKIFAYDLDLDVKLKLMKDTRVPVNAHQQLYLYRLHKVVLHVDTYSAIVDWTFYDKKYLTIVPFEGYVKEQLFTLSRSCETVKRKYNKNRGDGVIRRSPRIIEKEEVSPPTKKVRKEKDLLKVVETPPPTPEPEVPETPDIGSERRMTFLPLDAFDYNETDDNSQFVILEYYRDDSEKVDDRDSEYSDPGLPDPDDYLEMATPKQLFKVSFFTPPGDPSDSDAPESMEQETSTDENVENITEPLTFHKVIEDRDILKFVNEFHKEKIVFEQNGLRFVRESYHVDMSIPQKSKKQIEKERRSEVKFQSSAVVSMFCKRRAHSPLPLPSKRPRMSSACNFSKEHKDCISNYNTMLFQKKKGIFPVAKQFYIPEHRKNGC